jgi:hypothetical protein
MRGGLKWCARTAALSPRTYFWRRGNLVLATVLRCDYCNDNAIGMSRAYANVLDARAK